MKHSAKNKKPSAPPRPLPTAPAETSSKRWLVLGLTLALVAGGTWAFMEFVVWNTLPSELVGKWEVVQGPPEFKDAEFEFFRSGKMVGHLDKHDKVEIMIAAVRVEENKLYITTRRPRTGEELVSVQTIRTLSDREFITADERGRVIKMVRKR